MVPVIKIFSAGRLFASSFYVIKSESYDTNGVHIKKEAIREITNNPVQIEIDETCKKLVI